MLSDAGALIESLGQLLAKKRQVKQGAMQELLTGRKRLPGFELKPGCKQTDVGAVPQDWEVVDAGRIGRFRGGNGFPIAYQGMSSGEYPFFKVSDMNNEGNETFMEAANNYISEGTRRRLGANAFPPKTIAFAKVGAAVFLERKRILTNANCLDNNMAGYVISDPNVDHRYVHYFLLNFRLGSLVSTTALPSLNGSVLRGIKIPLPPTKAEQEGIAAILSDMDAELTALEAKHAKPASSSRE
jgi:type I restriction enzyme, S subunit